MSTTLATQSTLPGFCLLTEALEKLSADINSEERGAIYTRSEVVDFILDLTGYTTDKPLSDYRLLEPSFGEGDFIIRALDRLLTAAKRDRQLSYHTLEPAIRGVELHHASYKKTYALVTQQLLASGLNRDDADKLCHAWLQQGDYLLADDLGEFTHIVGNPPYIRQESIPDVLMHEYRQRYRTIYDRADIYVPFFEHSLDLLKDGGKLGFICADRWMKNKYGQKLRELISKKYSLKIYVDMVGTDAFQSEVSTYPAITIIENDSFDTTRVSASPLIDADYLRTLASELTSTHLPLNSHAHEIKNVAAGVDPWVLDSFEELALVRRLESQFPTLENAGCKVGIGVATGADSVFIAEFDSLDVEPSRKLPLAMTKDIQDGHIAWSGQGIINPFTDDGKLVDLDDFPKLKAYLDGHKEQILARYIAKNNPQAWFRTIDRINTELTYREKLLIPDIKGDASIAYENGSLYPHHNLYYLTSDDWDIRALQAVMRSGIARLFVSLYSTRMRGGYLRFQAQYLRKIRLPYWKDVSSELRARLTQYAVTNDKHELNHIVSELYFLSPEELMLIDRSTTT